MAIRVWRVSVLAIAAVLVVACAGERPPTRSAPVAPAPVVPPIPSKCDELVRAKAAAFDGTAEDSIPTMNASLNEGRYLFAEVLGAMGAAGPPCLRAMMDAERTDSAFLFQAATLLIALHEQELGDEPENVEFDDRMTSMKAAASALARVDLARVQRFIFVDDCVLLARHGIDTGDLADKYLVHPVVESYMPTNFGAPKARQLGRDHAAIFLYGTMPSARADARLLRVFQRPEPYARSSAALAACKNATPACFAALRTLADKEAFPEPIRREIEYALTRQDVTVDDQPIQSREEVVDALNETIRREFCRQAGDRTFVTDAISTLQPEDVDLVREARRHSIQHVHDASLGGYLFLTEILYGLINRYDLYADARRGS